MPRKPKPQTVTMKRGGFGKIETGIVIATVACAYTVGKQTLTGSRMIVQMNNARGVFGKSTRFTFATWDAAEMKGAA